MENATENWQLASGIWSRSLQSKAWKLVATPDGQVVSNAFPDSDSRYLLGAKADLDQVTLLPPDFDFSPVSGRPLDKAIIRSTSSWVPPYGALAIADLSRPNTQCRGLKQTSLALRLLPASSAVPLSAESYPQAHLPLLPPGRYHFLSDPLGMVASVLLAIDPDKGDIQFLLPESRNWTALNHESGGVLAERSGSRRGWRMEVVRGAKGTELYLPTVSGIAIVRPQLLELGYQVNYVGEGRALGGPVAWAGEIWMPLLANDGHVHLIGKPAGSAPPVVLTSSAIAPVNGFEAPVMDNRYVIWPCDEGQLMVRLNHNGKEEVQWIEWPEGTYPRFDLGSAFLSSTGVFWQTCWRQQTEQIEYVQMGKINSDRVAVDAPRLGTGFISYKKDRLIYGDPWQEPENSNEGASSQVVVPLIASTQDRAVISLRIEAPNGVFDLLSSGRQRHRAILQMQADKSADVFFGTLNVSQPWLAEVFIYDGYLWIYHPDESKLGASGWKLESSP